MACSPSKPLPWTPTRLTHTPCFVPCERMWPGSHPWGGVNPNDGLLRHIAQPWASLSSWPPQPIGPGPPGPHWERSAVWPGYPSQSLSFLYTPCPIPSCHALPCPGWLHSAGPTAWSSSSEDSATGCRPVVSVPCTMSAAPQLCVCVFIRGDSSAQWNKDAVNHNQMGVCAGGGGEGGKGIQGGWGRSLCVLNVQGMPRPNVGRWRLRAGGGWGLWGTEGWGCAAFGKMRIGVPRPEWKTCLLIEWTQELQQSLIKQEVLSNHCCVPLFHNQEPNCNIMRAAWRG